MRWPGLREQLVNEVKSFNEEQGTSLILYEARALNVCYEDTYNK